MAAPGRKRKPTALRVFEGVSSHRPINDMEPLPPKCEDIIPSDWIRSDCQYMTLTTFDLNKVSQLIWERVADPLNKIGVLTDIDKDKLLRYCYLFAIWLKCKAFIDKYGTEHPVYSEYWAQEQDPETKKRKTVWKRAFKKMEEYPAVTRILTISAELNRYEAEFGIGAAARTRIQTVLKNVFEVPEGGIPGDSSHGKPDPDFDYASKEIDEIVAEEQGTATEKSDDQA